jgi:hypothetical protein
MKRYRPRQLQVSGPTMVRTEDGTGPIEWVRYEDAAELQRRIDAILAALGPGPQPDLISGVDYAYKLHEWYEKTNIYTRIKAIAEGKS